MYPYYSQRDPRWASHTFSTAKLKIGEYGCTLTVLSAMSTWAGKEITPDKMADSCKFLQDGRILWNSIPSPLKFVWRYYQDDARKAKEILFSPNGMCLIQVQWGSQQHWLGLVGWDRNGAIVHDPWFGAKVSLKARPYYPIGMTELKK